MSGLIFGGAYRNRTGDLLTASG